MDSVIDLAISAEKYHVCHLKNQTLDVIRTALNENHWKVTPEALTTACNSVPAKYCPPADMLFGFAISCSVATWRRRNEGTNHYAKWETVFYDCSDSAGTIFSISSKGKQTP
jgi:hypothetical protein